ncbi:MAG: AAA family ATPase, partial [Candidatus Micrarchaeia archaeon]
MTNTTDKNIVPKLLRGGIDSDKEFVKAVLEDLNASSEASGIVTKAAVLASKIIKFNNYSETEIKGIKASGLEVPYNFASAATAILKQADSNQKSVFYTKLEEELGAQLENDELAKLESIGALDSIKKHAVEYAAYVATQSSNDSSTVKDLSVIRYFSNQSQIPKFYPVPGGQSESYFNSLVASAHSDIDLPILVYGPTGIAKTLAVHYLASVWNSRKLPVPHAPIIPLVTVQCTADSDTYSLIGHEILKNGNVKFQEGPLPMAIEAANKYGFAILLIDELSALNPETQKLLNPLLERKKVIFGEKEWTINPEAKLMVVATTNIAGE